MYKKMIILLISLTFINIILSSIIVFKNTENNYRKFMEEFEIEEQSKIESYIYNKMEKMKGIVESHAYWSETWLHLQNQQDEWLLQNVLMPVVENQGFSIDYVMISNEDMTYVKEVGGDYSKILMQDVYIQKSLNDDICEFFLKSIGDKKFFIYSTKIKDNDRRNPLGIYVAMIELDEDMLHEAKDLMFKSITSVELLDENDIKNYISEDAYYIEYNIGESGYILRMSYEEEYLKNFFVSNRNILILMLTSLFFLIIIIIFLVLRRIRNYIQVVIEAIVNVSKGNYDLKLTFTPKMVITELNVLTAAVDSLSSTINEKNNLLEKNYIEMVELLYESVNVIDEYTANHGLAVGIYAKMIAKIIDYKDIENVFLAAKIHDIGKIAVPMNILNKPGKISEEEFEIMKKHPEYGFKIIKNVGYFNKAKYGVKHHHENWDGTGYPDHLKGYEIPVIAQIIAIADIYDALTTARVYRQAFTHEQAKEIILSEKGVKISPVMVDAFLENEEDFRKTNEYINSHRKTLGEI